MSRDIVEQPTDFAAPKWAAIADSRDDFDLVEVSRTAEETLWVNRAGVVLGLIVTRGNRVSFYDTSDALMGTIDRTPLFRGPVGVPGCDCISCSGGLDV